MIRVNEKTVFSGCLFLFSAVILISTLNMRSDVVLVPRIACVGLLLLSAVQLLNDLIPSLQEKWPSLNKSSFDFSMGGEGQVDDTVESKEEVMQRFVFIGWMALFALLAYCTDIIIAILLSMFIYLKWISKQSWKMSIVYSVVMALAVYLIFVLGFKMSFFV